MHSPQLVFLDEPTSGLDPQSRANLWDHVRSLRDDFGVTIMLTTHYLDEADASPTGCSSSTTARSSPTTRPTT
jgi:ABC-2 type transport system ATP-binding protein